MYTYPTLQRTKTNEIFRFCPKSDIFVWFNINDSIFFPLLKLFERKTKRETEV